MEIPDAVTFTALLAFDSKQGYSKPERMRAALVAARPYLMPEREAVVEALERELRRQSADEWYDVPRLSRQLADVLALLNGES